MFEVLLGYITNIFDFINDIIDKIKSLVSVARGDSTTTTTVQSDEELLQSKSLFND